jgi:hypothetical protein
MKKCTKCGKDKNLEDFPKRKSSNDGYSTRCKECTNEATRKWRHANPEKTKEQRKRSWERNKEHEIKRNKQWKKDNAERVKETKKTWEEKNPDKVKAMKQRDYQKNKEKCDERNKKWHLKNPEKRKEYDKKYRLKDSVKELRRAWYKAQEYHKTVEQKARKALYYAVKVGEIVRPTTCSRCKEEGYIEGHHYDYSKPLDVIWLCKKCHAKEHLQNKRKKDG